jgi:NAD+ synthase (glutamine-hydrolysing)
VTLVGLPVRVGHRLFNAAVALQKGKILAVVPKTYLSDAETRWFTSSYEAMEESIKICGQIVPFGTDILLKYNKLSFGIEIGNDLWATVPPSSLQALAEAQLIFNLSTSNDEAGKHNYFKKLIEQQSARCIAGYVYASSGFGESSTDLLFSGSSLIAENGTILAENKRFSLEEQLLVNDIDIERLISDRQKNSCFTQNASSLNFRKIPFELPVYQSFSLDRKINSQPFIPEKRETNERYEEILNIQVNALATRLYNTGIKSVVVGVSGGLDSTLALLVCAKTFDKIGISRQNIHGITMPGFGTTSRTYNNAAELIRGLGISFREIDIKAACIQHFKDINQSENCFDITYENAQARERMQILMDIANQSSSLVVGTGDLSELALGWATYNGDHISMYAINAGVPKTLIHHLVRWVAENSADSNTHHTLMDIISTPVSPELLPAADNGEISQRTEDVVGPYELHDFFLYYMIRFGFRPAKIFFLAQTAFSEKYNNETIKKWLKTFLHRFFTQQFKRSCLPDAPKIGSVSLSPRGGWQMPSDASASMWLADLECEI